MVIILEWVIVAASTLPVIALIATRNAFKYPLLTIGCVGFAILLALKNTLLYTVVDQAVGGHNRAVLLMHMAGLVATIIFDDIIIRSATSTKNRGRWRFTVYLLGLTGACLQVAVFMASSWPITDVELIHYDRETSALAFKSVLWLSLITTASMGIVACRRNLRVHFGFHRRLPIYLIAIGCFGVLLVTLLVARGWVNSDHISKGTDLALSLAGGAFLAAGFSYAPITDRWRARQQHQRERYHLVRLRPIWTDLMTQIPAARRRNGGSDDDYSELYGYLSECEDALLLHANLSGDQYRVLEEARAYVHERQGVPHD
ncbi:hypothetical protein [Rathayibacter sp. VKM Ac-2928]|uniref:hypothetical protein n=1 Tax=Rathayibacter sp. VKM Ac-2928 TaxID=2929479 RepID=UPI001FB26D6B|nr:hypothetical protein [Rathayibacter sp. VKM Ac-2928]